MFCNLAPALELITFEAFASLKSEKEGKYNLWEEGYDLM